MSISQSRVEATGSNSDDVFKEEPVTQQASQPHVTRSEGGQQCVARPQESIAAEVIDDVVTKNGPAAVIGRYHTSRSVEKDFTLQRRVLGSGCSGSVQLAKDGRGRSFAVKTLSKEDMTDPVDQQFMKDEINIHLTLDHPHVVRLEHVYETKKQLRLVLEHMEGGDLYKRWLRKGRFTEREAAACISQILLGVSYLHARGVVHRDIKMENVMYKDRACTHLKLIDVGMATRWDGVNNITHACGTPLFLAPEIWKRSYTDKVDVWAVGLIAFELLTNKSPFPESQKDQRLKEVRRGNVKYGREFTKLSAAAQDFVTCLLTVDVASRPSAAMAMEHSWLRSFDGVDSLPELSVLKGFEDLTHPSSCKRACFFMLAGELSLKEQSLVQKAFHAIDKDRSGSIQLDEFCNAMRHIGMDEADAMHAFQQFTGDQKVSEISYSDFLAAGLHSGAVVNNDACRAVFQRFDADKSGTITDADRTMSMSTTLSGIGDLIEEADANSDGEVSFDEFVEYLQLPPIPANYIPMSSRSISANSAPDDGKHTTDCASCFSWFSEQLAIVQLLGIRDYVRTAGSGS